MTRGQRLLDVLIPTYERPAALAVTLAGLSSQTLTQFRVVVSDQSETAAAAEAGEVQAVIRTLRTRNRAVRLERHLPRRGMAEHRDYLLSLAEAPYALFLDDDLLLEPRVLARMLSAIQAEGCGFVGCAPIGLSYAEEERPDEHPFEPWEGPVLPEKVTPNGDAWQRHELHNAANVLHVQQENHVARYTKEADGEEYIPYRVAWVGGCVLYDVEKLRDVGGFGFWRELPAEHAGEDVLVQLRVMERFGGCGIMPSGVVHLELPTTVENREVDAAHALTTSRSD